MSDEEKTFDGELLPEKSSSPIPTSGESHLAKIADMEADTAIEYFKNRVKVLENITLLAIGSTRHSDWVKMGKKMYCQISGTSRIMRNLGCVYQIVDLKKTFSTADIVGRCVIFNIGGGKYRLVVRTNFFAHRMWIKYVLPHEKYEKLNLKEDPKCLP